MALSYQGPSDDTSEGESSAPGPRLTMVTDTTEAKPRKADCDKGVPAALTGQIVSAHLSLRQDVTTQVASSIELNPQNLKR